MVEVQHFFSFLPGLPCGSHRLLADFWEETLWGRWSHSLKANLCLSYLGKPSSLVFFLFRCASNRKWMGHRNLRNISQIPSAQPYNEGSCRSTAGVNLSQSEQFYLQNVFFKCTVLCVVKINADHFYFCPPDMFDTIIVRDRWLSRDVFVGCVWNKGVDGLPAVGILFLPLVKLSCPERSLGRKVHLCKFQITFRK